MTAPDAVLDEVNALPIVVSGQILARGPVFGGPCVRNHALVLVRAEGTGLYHVCSMDMGTGRKTTVTAFPRLRDGAAAWAERVRLAVAMYGDSLLG